MNKKIQISLLMSLLSFHLPFSSFAMEEEEISRTPKRSRLSAATTPIADWKSQQVDLGKGTRLRFYPQDSKVNLDQSTLDKEAKHYFSQIFSNGPSDREMGIEGKQVLISNVDKIALNSEEFDSLSTFAVTRLTANMWRATLQSLIDTFPTDDTLNNVAKYWDNMPHGFLKISPRGLFREKNAYYSRAGSNCELKFGYYSIGTSSIFTCRTPDIVAHETGHYSLDRLRPSFYDEDNLQTGAFHEAFGDISALNFVFQDDAMAQALINSTKGDLHTSNNFAARLAEEFGISLGMPGYLRNADNDYKMSDVEGEVHAMSEVFTGAYYDAIVSAYKAAVNQYKARYALVGLLQDTTEYARNLLLHAAVSVKDEAPNFSDIASQLKIIADQHSQTAPANVSYLKDLAWSSYFNDEFARRQVSSARIRRMSLSQGLSSIQKYHLKNITCLYSLDNE